jgi:hypothetical protein
VVVSRLRGRTDQTKAPHYSNRSWGAFVFAFRHGAMSEDTNPNRICTRSILGSDAGFAGRLDPEVGLLHGGLARVTAILSESRSPSLDAFVRTASDSHRASTALGRKPPRLWT